MTNPTKQLHRVKSWSYLFQAIKSGIKTHDIRDTLDRSYQVGDILHLMEFDQETGVYSGDTLNCEITYITDRNLPCAFSSAVLHRDYAILSIKLIPRGEGDAI